MTAHTNPPADPAAHHRPVLYLIGCAAPPVHHIRTAITQAQDRAYDTCLILTPTAAAWLDKDLDELAELTGHPVRSSYKQPGTPDALPSPDAFLVAPMTLNTTTKWADGHQDNLALGLIAEAAGRRIHDAVLGLPLQPIVALPYLNAWQAAHPAFARGVSQLETMGVRVPLGGDGFTPHVPHSGQSRPDAFPWQIAFDVFGENHFNQ
ncbi:flavoprotein [Actinospica robiniae]|uniref:flavoprotein n=1 Tax=Actinospica robiniae TaxID=304901 RepID=UPI0006888FAA|nr:flavoprotein [Actinospica robiniae]